MSKIIESSNVGTGQPIAGGQAAGGKGIRFGDDMPGGIAQANDAGIIAVEGRIVQTPVEREGKGGLVDDSVWHIDGEQVDAIAEIGQGGRGGNGTKAGPLEGCVVVVEQCRLEKEEADADRGEGQQPAGFEAGRGRR